MFQEYLKHFPNSLADRCSFASIAWHTGHWQEGLDALNDLNDVDVDQFNGASKYRYLRRKALAAVAKP